MLAVKLVLNRIVQLTEKCPNQLITAHTVGPNAWQQELLTDRLTRGKRGWDGIDLQGEWSLALACSLSRFLRRNSNNRAAERAKLATYPAATSTEALLFCLASPQMLSVLTTEFNIPSEATITLKHEIALSTPPSSSSNEYPHQLSPSGIIITTSHIQY
jgi:hypothetical protein